MSKKREIKLKQKHFDKPFYRESGILKTMLDWRDHVNAAKDLKLRECYGSDSIRSEFSGEKLAD